MRVANCCTNFLNLKGKAEPSAIQFIALLLSISVFFIAASRLCSAQSNIDESNKIGIIKNSISSHLKNGSRVANRAAYEMHRLADPKTGQIPPNIRLRELTFARNLPVRKEFQSVMLAKANELCSQNWIPCGPYNLGGRTRALAIDLDYNASSNKRILAGGVSGGMYLSEDSGNSWRLTTLLSDLPSVTCIAQDPKEHNVWYYGTGEWYGNSASTFKAPYLGQGIFKSTDSGNHWAQLPSTTMKNNLNSFDSVFDIIWNIAVHPATSAVFAATYGGIQRSEDGGTTWNQVLGSNISPYNEITDIAIASSGVIYATLSRNGANVASHGIFRSDDGGDNWINISPTNLAADPYRMVIGPAPSNPGIVYLIVQATEAGDKPNVHQFFKYNSATNTWSDLSSFLPNFQDSFHAGIGYFNSQGGYDLLVKVKPDNPNIVWIGGTNLYRSLDGGKTFAWVGGYHPQYYEYPNQHPDQQALAFFPNNPNSLISGHDGGLSLALNNLQSTQSWTSLNNGYLTTQFYSVAIDPQPGSDLLIIGGMQDNGSWATSVIDYKTPWTNVLGGDGGFTAVAPGGKIFYVSAQKGNTVRVSNFNNQTVETVVTPADANNFLFVTPFQLDPNDPQVMYLAAGNLVWRNSNLAGIPSGNQDSTKINWSALSNSATANTTVTALAVSKTPANRLYYGATDYRNVTVIKRLDDAVSNGAGVDITPSRITAGSYPSCISTNPSNADEILVTFSNYSVPSIWYSNDKGADWTDVEGNLGGTDGPSICWSVILPTNTGNVYFVGTSVGIFSTDQLSGSETIWAQEGDEVIGNVVVDMIVARPVDGFIVAGTHGRGVYCAWFSGGSVVVNNDNNFIPDRVRLAQNYPNPFNPSTTIPFHIQEPGRVYLDIYNSIGQKELTLVNQYLLAGEYQVDFQNRQLPSGLYIYRLTANGFTVSKKMMILK